MNYSKELNEILDELKNKCGDSFTDVDVFLKILEQYYEPTMALLSTEEGKSKVINKDFQLIGYLKVRFPEKKEYMSLISDIISYKESPEGLLADSFPEQALEQAEKDAKKYPDPLDGDEPEIKCFHYLMGASRVNPKLLEILEEYGTGYIDMANIAKCNNEVFNEMNGIVGSAYSKMMNFIKNEFGNTPFDDENVPNPGELFESTGFPHFSDSNEEEKEKGKSFLKKYGINLLEEDLDPIYGRESELTQLLEILECKKKNNAILIGDAGVGKTSIVELLAQKIKSKEVPLEFQNKVIYRLDLNSLVAGTKYRGQYEERLQKIIEEVIKNPNIIVFIDEIHNLIGNGGSEGGTGDAANILKPYLSKGKFQCIGSTTFKEYRKFIEPDAALKRRFQTITVHEPTLDETRIILKNIKSYYEKHHRVSYSKEVLDACVDLAEKYLPASKFPDKAIDAMDLAGSLCRIDNGYEKSDEINSLKSSLSDIKKKKNELVSSLNFDDALIQRDQELEIKSKIDGISDSIIKVGLECVYKAIGKRCGVPIDKIGSSDLEKLRHLKEILGKEVIGQEEAVKEIVTNLQKNSLSIRDTNKPVSLLFTGPTGCGKTYICKKLAEEFFGSKDSLIRFDMGEFEEKHTISKLIGATASYVGYNDDPLFEKIRQNPYSVVLFDEIEKAAPEIFQIFLNILDEGYVTLGNGTKVDFRHCIVIFTGNIGTKEASLRSNSLGYYDAESKPKKDREVQEKIINTSIKKTFSPEFINRLSKIVIFSALSNEDLQKIINLELAKLSDRLKKSKITVKVSKQLKEYIITQCDLKFGARDLQRKISEIIEERLCEKLLDPEIPSGKKTFAFDYKDNEVLITMK